MPNNASPASVSPDDFGYAVFTHVETGAVIRPYRIACDDLSDIPAIGMEPGTERRYGFALPNPKLERLLGAGMIAHRTVDDVLVAIVTHAERFMECMVSGIIVTDDALPQPVQSQIDRHRLVREQERAIEEARLADEARRKAVHQARCDLYAPETSGNVACGGYADIDLPRDVLDSVFSVYDNAYEPELDYIYDPYFEEQWL